MRKEYIFTSSKPKTEEEKDMEWLCKTLGLIGPRDKEKTTMKILKIIVRHSRHGKPVTITLISQKIGISKAAVIHHLNKLQERGLILQTRRYYELRRPTIEETIQEMHRDIDKMFTQMMRISEDLDNEFF